MTDYAPFVEQWLYLCHVVNLSVWNLYLDRSGGRSCTTGKKDK
jgi:hypothetical protein